MMIDALTSPVKRRRLSLKIKKSSKGQSELLFELKKVRGTRFVCSPSEVSHWNVISRDSSPRIHSEHSVETLISGWLITTLATISSPDLKVSYLVIIQASFLTGFKNMFLVLRRWPTVSTKDCVHAIMWFK